MVPWSADNTPLVMFRSGALTWMLMGVTLVTMVVSEFSACTARILDRLRLSAKGSVVMVAVKSTDRVWVEVVLMLGQLMATLLVPASVVIFSGVRPSVSSGLNTTSTPKVVLTVVASSTGKGK